MDEVWADFPSYEQLFHHVSGALFKAPTFLPPPSENRNLTHSQGVVAEEAGEAAGAVLQGEGLAFGVVGGGFAGVVAGVCGCGGEEDVEVRLLNGGLPPQPVLKPGVSASLLKTASQGGTTPWKTPVT